PRHVSHPGADRGNVAAAKALRLSRLLDRRESQNGLQGPLPPARGIECARLEHDRSLKIRKSPWPALNREGAKAPRQGTNIFPGESRVSRRGAAAHALEAAVDPLSRQFFLHPVLAEALAQHTEIDAVERLVLIEA